MWVECQRTLWPETNYPDSYFEGDQTILARLGLEELDAFTQEVRECYTWKKLDFVDEELEQLRPKGFTPGKFFVKPHQGQDMPPYEFATQRTHLEAAMRPPTDDPAGILTHLIIAIVTHDNLEDKSR